MQNKKGGQLVKEQEFSLTSSIQLRVEINPPKTNFKEELDLEELAYSYRA